MENRGTVSRARLDSGGSSTSIGGMETRSIMGSPVPSFHEPIRRSPASSFDMQGEQHAPLRSQSGSVSNIPHAGVVEQLEAEVEIQRRRYEESKRHLKRVTMTAEERQLDDMRNEMARHNDAIRVEKRTREKLNDSYLQKKQELLQLKAQEERLESEARRIEQEKAIEKLTYHKMKLREASEKKEALDRVMEKRRMEVEAVRDEITKREIIDLDNFDEVLKHASSLQLQANQGTLDQNLKKKYAVALAEEYDTDYTKKLMDNVKANRQKKFEEDKEALASRIETLKERKEKLNERMAVLSKYKSKSNDEARKVEAQIRELNKDLNEAEQQKLEEGQRDGSGNIGSLDLGGTSNDVIGKIKNRLGEQEENIRRMKAKLDADRRILSNLEKNDHAYDGSLDVEIHYPVDKRNIALMCKDIVVEVCYKWIEENVFEVLNEKQIRDWEMDQAHVNVRLKELQEDRVERSTIIKEATAIYNEILRDMIIERYAEVRVRLVAADIKLVSVNTIIKAISSQAENDKINRRMVEGALREMRKNRDKMTSKDALVHTQPLTEIALDKPVTKTGSKDTGKKKKRKRLLGIFGNGDSSDDEEKPVNIGELEELEAKDPFKNDEVLLLRDIPSGLYKKSVRLMEAKYFEKVSFNDLLSISIEDSPTITAMAVSRDMRLIALGTNTAEVGIFDVSRDESTGEITATHVRHISKPKKMSKTAIIFIAFSNDGTSLAVVYDTSVVISFDLLKCKDSRDYDAPLALPAMKLIPQNFGRGYMGVKETIGDLRATAVTYAPGMNILGTSTGLMTGHKNGIIMKAFIPSAGKTITHPPPGEPLKLVMVNPDPDKDDITGQREFFQAHKASVKFLFHIQHSGDMLSIDSQDRLAIWSYSRDTYSTFGWYNPRKIYKIQCAMAHPVASGPEVDLFPPQRYKSLKPTKLVRDDAFVYQAEREFAKINANPSLDRNNPWSSKKTSEGVDQLTYRTFTIPPEGSDFHHVELYQGVLLKHISQQFKLADVPGTVVCAQLTTSGRDLVMVQYFKTPPPRPAVLLVVCIDLERMKWRPLRKVYDTVARPTVCLALSSVVESAGSDYAYLAIENKIHVLSLATSSEPCDPIKLKGGDKGRLQEMRVLGGNNYLALLYEGRTSVDIMRVYNNNDQESHQELKSVAAEWPKFPGNRIYTASVEQRWRSNPLVVVGKHLTIESGIRKIISEIVSIALGESLPMSHVQSSSLQPTPPRHKGKRPKENASPLDRRNRRVSQQSVATGDGEQGGVDSIPPSDDNPDRKRKGKDKKKDKKNRKGGPGDSSMDNGNPGTSG